MSSPEHPDLDWVAGGGDHKLEKLCSQVEEAIALALVSSRDAELRELLCDRVEPLRGAARLRVWISLGPGAELEPGDAEAALERASGYLRAEVARAISRKRVPELSFELTPPDP